MNDLCPSCGTPTEPGSMFCDNCGAKLEAPTPVAAPAPVAAAADAGVTCPGCGHVNVPGSVFCENCGQSLGQVPAAPAVPAASPVPAAAPAPVAPPPLAAPAAAAISGHFIMVDTNTTIAIPAGKSELLLGREDPVSQIFPEIDLDPHDGLNNGVSRRHAKITLENGQLMLEDLNTVNYTHLNGQRLNPGQKYPLKGGDELMLGKLHIRYEA